MRLRLGVGLPGPFYLTSGHRRRRSGNVGAVVFLVAVVALLCFASPWFAVVVGAFLVFAVVAVVHDYRHGIAPGKRR